jgi:hypothetical protein
MKTWYNASIIWKKMVLDFPFSGHCLDWRVGTRMRVRISSNH